MANAIIRDVVVKNSSTTKNFIVKSKESNKETYYTTTIDKCNKIVHRLVGCAISCAGRTSESHSDSSKNTNITNIEHLKRKLVTATTRSKKSKNKNNEAIDISKSYTSSEDSSYSLKTFETFSSQNISSSTAFETTTEEFPDTDSLRTPPNQRNFRALGILQEKRSPLYGPPLNTPSKGISLRSQKPFYTQRVLYQSQKFKENIDYTAIEAISMNGGKAPYNGPLGTFSKTNSSGGIGTPATDINRNNGAPRNWTVMTATNNEKREHLYKILVIGELGTGKTSFIKRYVHQFFSQNYRATIGVDFALKVLHWDPNTIVRLQLWDIAGQERFGNMTRVYYKEAVGAFIVFDVTRSGTFDCVSKWKEDLDSKVQLPDGSPIPCILLANKCDQDKQGVVTNNEKMDEYVKEHGFAGWFETSAKENINIDEAARALVNKILLNDKLISAADLADSEKFNLKNSADQTALDGKSKCSC